MFGKVFGSATLLIAIQLMGEFGKIDALAINSQAVGIPNGPCGCTGKPDLNETTRKCECSSDEGTMENTDDGIELRNKKISTDADCKNHCNGWNNHHYYGNSINQCMCFNDDKEKKHHIYDGEGKLITVDGKHQTN